jgi:hypothetical protein
MYADPDKFTDHDRALLEDEHGREIAAIRTQLGKGLVQIFEKRETFSFEHPDLGTLRFDVHSIKKALLEGRLVPHMFKIKIEPDFYEHVLNNNGVEAERLDKLSDRDLQRPGIMVTWPDGHSTLIDGNHRMCGLYKRGVTLFRFLMVPVMDCVPFMARPGDEERLFGTDDNAIRVAGKVWLED